jgi:hypothetical protein
MELKTRHEKSEIGDPSFSYEDFREFTINSIKQKLERYRK